jgi:hypothetical protein
MEKDRRRVRARGRERELNRDAERYGKTDGETGRGIRDDKQDKTKR